MGKTKQAVMGAALWCLGSLGGCASAPVGSNLADELKNAPEWVKGDCRVYYKDRKDVVCGVGSVGSTRNISLARSGAEARGRAEIARSLQVQVKSMVKDYQATVTGGEAYGTAAADEQSLADVSKQITDLSLSGTRMDATWISPSGTYFSLISLNSEEFAKAVSGMTSLNEGVRKAVAVEQRAKQAFEDLDKATAPTPVDRRVSGAGNPGTAAPPSSYGY